MTSVFKMSTTSLRLVLSFLATGFLQVYCANAGGCGCHTCPCTREGLTIFRINGWFIVCTILLIIFVVAFTVFFFVVERRHRENELVGEQTLTVYTGEEQTGLVRFRHNCKELIFHVTRKAGLLCAKYPYFVITLALVVVYFLTSRVGDIRVSSDPVEVWSPPNSEAFKQKQYFTENFKYTPRETRVILSYHGHSIESSDGVNEMSYILSHSILTKVLELQNRIQNIKVLDKTENEYVTLADVCITPLAPQSKECQVKSVLNYWQNNQERLDFETTDKDGTPFDYKDHFQACLSDPSLMNDGTPLNQSCRGPLKNSVLPDDVLGGYTDSNYKDATALFIYIPLTDYSKDDPGLQKTLLWENAFLDFMTNYTIGTLKISFSAERSLSDEQLTANQISTKLTILLTYSVMFIYMTFALGKDPASPSNKKINARIVVALSGILIILVSVVSAFSVAYSWGYVIAPIAIQVVPFLSLSVGWNNIFVFFEKYDNLRPLRRADFDHMDFLANIVGLSAPSISAATISQAIAFYLASIVTDTPAIKTFAICATLSVVFNFVLQFSVLISIVELEYRHRDQIARLFSCMEKKLDEQADENPPASNEEHEKPATGGRIYKFFSKFYAPLLTSPGARYIVILATAISCYISITVMGFIDVGVAEQSTVLQDSYLQKYYTDFNTYSKIGPEVYFVVKSGYNYSTAEGQDKICSEHQCQLNSLTAQLTNASMYPSSTKIAHPATSWLDDYLEWIQPNNEPVCCQLYDESKDKFCLPEAKNASCIPCLSNNDTESTSKRPTSSEMNEFVLQFLSQPPTTACPKGGKLLSDSVSLHPDGSIGATYFATNFIVLTNPVDYIDAFSKANRLSEQIEDVLNSFSESATKNEVFPYSEFFIYCSQYDNLVILSVKSLSVTFCVMCLTKGLLLGLSFAVAPLITGALVLFTINLFGTLFFLGIAFSEITLVNIIICIGIAGEMFTHIADNFSSQVWSEPTSRLTRTRETVSNSGSTLLKGNVLPKLLSFVGLIFLRSDVVQADFSNIYVAMTGLLFFHGLVFVPVLMSFIGPFVRPSSSELDLLLSLKPPENPELTPILPGDTTSGAATSDNNGQPTTSQ